MWNSNDPVEPARRARILVVDDDPVLRRTLVRILESLFDIVLAESVAGALEELERSPYDVVLSDDKMPDGLGRALLATIRLRYPSTRRVLMSGQDIPSERDLDPAWERFVQKPFAPASLVALLDGLDLSKISEVAVWPKECACCGASWTAKEWNDLSSVGMIFSVDGESLELRLCTCRSILAIPA